MGGNSGQQLQTRNDQRTFKGWFLSLWIRCVFFTYQLKLLEIPTQLVSVNLSVYFYVSRVVSSVGKLRAYCFNLFQRSKLFTMDIIDTPNTLRTTLCKYKVLY